MPFKEPYDWYAKEGYLRATPLGGLTLYDYTDRTALEWNWNFHTETARGLILDKEGNIIARPWRKFFSLNERPDTNLNVLPNETPELSEKYDGSMIIVFFNPETKKWQACTRGSFDNKQSRVANAWLESRGHLFDKEYTYMFELVAPWNRIVVHYPTEEMILTGIIHTINGDDWSYAKVREWGLAHGLNSVHFETKPLAELDLDAPVVNQEGYVARFSNGMRVKMKYSQYIQIHAIVTIWSSKKIWNAIRDGEEPDLTNLPEEFRIWFDKNKTQMHDDARRISRELAEIFDKTPNLSTRREYYEYYTKWPNYSRLLMQMLDGIDCKWDIWEMVRPKQSESFFKNQCEE